ncbi:hypothetical protein MPTK1_1g28920 [Marchantia polymorpha subsp. ruderalis]|nr:hypothetical protein MARPO_0107s0008 [Marchantia polymorpha]BBN00407.1 hypothetical protein Mp_1g28920 [Marchantia polymorpha subsp. ruderalis]|eukprot:PTQ31732.1 hypothetical protein MARPO_0107s0008 [Marchantia polymorpha]
MSYTIRVRVIQSEPTSWYSIVEKTVWHYGNGGTWSEVDGEQILKMGDSGTSGVLRFQNQAGDLFLVALGVHNWKRWCDIVPDLKTTETAMAIHPTYYDENGPRYQILWKQLESFEKDTSNGENIRVEYYREDDHDLYATITIST